MKSIKEPVRLRSRLLPSGNTTLYLDIYIHGKRSYEFLNLYLVPEKGRADKEKNRETRRLAETIRAKRLVEFQNDRFGFENPLRTDTNFLEYFRRTIDRHDTNPESTSNRECWTCTLRHLEVYCAPSTTFRDVTPEFVRGFRDYLDRRAICLPRGRNRSGTVQQKQQTRPLSETSKDQYFKKLKACLNHAVRDNIILRNPALSVEGFKRLEQERAYLTIDELTRLAATECGSDILRRTFIFSCLTGLRKSDIQKLKWSEVRQEGDFVRIVFRQKKTGGQEYIDLNPQAVSLMGERGEPDSKVFPGFLYSTYLLMQLRQWAAKAGIKKDITFHCGRHTFAVMVLGLGADLFTVQKLLGHKDIKTTQVYAKIIDKKKQEAAMLIPSILPTGDKIEGSK